MKTRKTDISVSRFRFALNATALPCDLDGKESVVVHIPFDH